jgi:hypothetical protein
MFQWLLRGLVFGVFRRLLVILLMPVVLIIATPFILLRAGVLAVRRKQRFKFAVSDGYGSVWDALISAFTWMVYTDVDRLDRIHRELANELRR